MGLAILFCTLLVLMRINFKKAKIKIVKFFQNHYLKAVVLIIFLLNTMNLLYNASYSMEVIKNEASPVSQQVFAVIVNVYERLIENLKKYDTGLYRTVSKFQNAANDSLTYGYNGISYSGSTYSKKLHTFLEKLGMRKSHVQVLCNLENTKAVDMLLGIKYLIVAPNQTLLKEYPIEYEELYIENNVKIHKNPYFLSLGYAVNEGIFNTNMDKMNTFELQNDILKNMTGIKENVYIEHKGEITEDLENVRKDINLYRKDGEEGKIIYEFEAQSDDNIYMQLLASGDTGIEVNVNGGENINHSGFTSNEMINIGKRTVGEKVKVEIKTHGDIVINNIYVYYEDIEALKKHYDILSKEQVKMQKIDNRTYKGHVNIEEKNKYVMFTIPYEKGWQIKVDGKEVKYEEVLDALITINLDKGEHEIVLEYMPSGMYIGIIASLVGILILVIKMLTSINK